MSEEIVSRITDEHRAIIGVKTDPRKLTVNAEDARRMRDVIGDTDPRYADGTGVAPPYIIAMVSGRPPRGASIMPNGILTQQEWRFDRPIRIGEELSAVSQVVDIRDRLGGRYGYSVLVTTSTDFFDTDGNHVAASLVTSTQFDPAGLRKEAGE